MLYDVISEQLGGAVTAVADKLAIMEKEGLLKDGECIEMKLFDSDEMFVCTSYSVCVCVCVCGCVYESI